MAMEVDSGDSSKKKKKTGRGRPEMNVTPLVDVVLVLLIIFMVITPMLNEHFWVHVPLKPQNDQEPAEPESNTDEPIVVSVNARGQIQINRDVYSDAEFPARLRRMLVAQGDRKIYFDANDHAEFERAMQVMDLARASGAAHIAVSTEAIAR